MYQALTKELFPNLGSLDLFRVNLNNFSVNENVTSVACRNCQFAIKEPFFDENFAFPNTECLVLDAMLSEINLEFRLPKLPRLKHLEVRNCVIKDKLSSKKFPSLRSMVLEGVSVCAGIKITRLNALHRLELVDIEKLPLKTNWYGVRMLSLTKVRGTHLYKLVNIEVFPKLAALYIDIAEDLNLKVLQPHAILKKLSIKTSGKIPCLSDLQDRFPLIMEISLDGEVDEMDVPSLPTLKKVEVIPCPLFKYRRAWFKKCRNLKLFNGKDMKLDQKWFNCNK